MSSERRTADASGAGRPSRPSAGYGGPRGDFARRWKDAALAALALPWSLSFAIAGLVSPRRPARWSSPGGLRVLVVAPHPDDEVAGCAGTLLLHRARGDSVVVVHVTDGRRSRALGLGADEMARRRRGEAERAAELLDVDLRWIGLPEGEWREDDLVAALAPLLETTSPDLVYAPSRVDFHPEHRRVASALADALGGAAGPRIRVYEVQVPLTSVLVTSVSPTGAVAIPARRALEAYGTQLGSLRRTLRAKRYLGLRYRAGAQAEGFWEMSAEAYRALHASGGPLSGPGSDAPAPSGAAALPGERGGGIDPRPAFRGLRRFPLSDPLAYLVGRDERRRLLLALPEGGGARATPA